MIDSILMFLCIWLSLKVEYIEHMFFVCVHASCVCVYVLMHVEARGRCQMSSSVFLPYSLRQRLSLNSQADSGWLSSEFQGVCQLVSVAWPWSPGLGEQRHCLPQLLYRCKGLGLRSSCFADWATFPDGTHILLFI